MEMVLLLSAENLQNQEILNVRVRKQFLPIL